MKLRLLNAGHSCLAYLSAVAGAVTVDEALAKPELARFLEVFLRQEALPHIPRVAGIDLDEYVNTIVARFSNPQIGDQIDRLCIDGSAKFPKFLLPTVRAQLEAANRPVLSALALAGWCHYLCGASESGRPPTPAPDPLLAAATAFAHRSLDDPKAFVEFAEVFGTELPRQPLFVDTFVDALNQLRRQGVLATIETALETYQFR